MICTCIPEENFAAGCPGSGLLLDSATPTSGTGSAGIRVLAKSMMKKRVSWSMLSRKGWRETLRLASSRGLAGSGLTLGGEEDGGWRCYDGRIASS